MHIDFRWKGWLLILALWPGISWAQADKAFRLLDSGDLTGAWSLFERAAGEVEEKGYARFGQAQLLADQAFARYNLDSAYHYLRVAEESYRALDYKHRKNWERFSISDVRSLQRDIGEKAVAAALAEKSPERADAVLAQYDRLSARQKRQLIEARNRWLWVDRDPARLIDLFRRYRADFAAYTPHLLWEMERQLFDREVGAGNWGRYAEFAERFPEHSYVRDRLMEKAEALKLKRDPKAYFQFMDNHGRTPFRALILDSLAAAVAFRGDLEDCARYANEFAGEAPDRAVWEHYYNLYKRYEFSEAAIRAFADRYPDFPLREQLRNDLDFFVGKKMEALTKTAFTMDGARDFLETYPEYPGADKLWRLYFRAYQLNHPAPEDIDRFAETHPGYPFPDSLVLEKRRIINRRAEGLLRNEGIPARNLLAFLQDYPETDRREDIWRRIYDLETAGEPDVKQLEDFLDRYRDYPFATEVMERIATKRGVEERQRFADMVDLHRAFRFLRDYPESALRPQMEALLYEWLQGSEKAENLMRFLDYFPDSPYRQEVLAQLYQVSTSSGSLADILAFEKKYPDFADRDRIEKDKALTMLPNVLGVQYREELRAPFENYIRQAAPDDKAFRALQRFLGAELAAKDWAGARSKVERFAPAFGTENERYNELRAMLSEEGPEPMRPEPISNRINTPAEEYAPFISADGRTLLFCGRFRDDNLGREDIFIAEKKDGDWQSPALLRDLSTSRGNEAPEALSADENTMLLFVNGTLGISEKTAEGWSPMQELPPTVNRARWQADARITADGRALLFASSEGAYGLEDIYVSLKEEDGAWGEAINLGPVINTAVVDRTPFLHPDMKTLYFGSEGHTGLGKMDIFMSKRLRSDSWTDWSKPVNLGIAINTAGHDWDFKVTTDGAYAYFTISNDIYLAALPRAFQPERVATVSGKLLGIDGRPLAAEIVWEDLETGEVVQVSKSDPQSGDFFATLPSRSVFGYTVRREGYFPLSGNVDFTEAVSDIKLDRDMVLATVEEMKASDLRLPLNNLFFETGKYNIRPRSFPELDRLAEWINSYELEIEVLGHTDFIGEEEANLLLSRNRANAVRRYLIERGAPPERISARGFGESQPVAPNETAEGRTLNRRVEIRIRN